MGAAEAKWGETIAEAKAATDAAVEEVQTLKASSTDDAALAQSVAEAEAAAQASIADLTARLEGFISTNQNGQDKEEH